MTRQNVYMAEYQGQQGDAYHLNTIQYRFRPAVVGGVQGWITVDHDLALWSEWCQAQTVDDPAAPTHAEQLAWMEAQRLAMP